MTTERTSNKQILDAILALTEAITATKVAPVVQKQETPTESTVNVDAAYLNHMTTKVADFAKAKGEDAIIYARKNGRGETKLAYCVASKWTGLKDRGLIGAVKHISAS